MTSVREVLEDWSEEELGNLNALLKLPISSSIEKICDSFKWRYHSKSRASVEATASNLKSKVLTRLKGQPERKFFAEERRTEPTYEDLISGACAHLKVSEDEAITKDLEVFLVQGVIVAALQKMKPRERKDFFEQQIDVANAVNTADLPGSNLSGPLTTIALLGLSQASGFGIYMASTTALGFVTHAVGVTLPFAVFTGMTSTIAFIIGPVGWLSAGLWSVWKLTDPGWKTLIPALIYIIAVNSRKKLDIESALMHINSSSGK